jgi:hypothetical protein
MITDDDLNVEDLLADFSTEKSLSELDQAILDHATDGWPLGQLAKQHGTTPNALNCRKKELFAQFREYLERRGICSSGDVFEQ